MKYINLDTNNEIESPNGFNNVAINLGKDSGIVAIEFNKNCEKRILEAIQKYYNSNLVIRNENEVKLLYKTDMELESTVNSYTNIGVLVSYSIGDTNVVIKRDGKLLYEGELTFDNFTPLPDILLPIKDESAEYFGGHDSFDSLSIYLGIVRRNYYDIDLKKIADFTNDYVFQEPLYRPKVDEIVEEVCSRVQRDYKTLAEYEEKDVEWLWEDRIPSNAITLLAGDPGCGKSQISVQIASIVSTGAGFPFSDNERKNIEPSIVVLQNGEDSIEHVLKPRLSRAGANHNNIIIINEEEKMFTLSDLKKIEKIFKELKPKLMIIDPLQRYIGDVNMNSMSEVRACLKPVGDLAQKYSCAVLIIMHLNKSNSKALHRIGGSVDLTGIARSVLMVEDLEDDEDEKVLLQIKSNYGNFGKPIVFDITDKGVNFIEPRSFSELNIKGKEAPKSSKKQVAKDFLVDMLCKGEVEGTILAALAKEEGIAKSTLDRAKTELGVISEQKEKNKWFCSLPKRQDNSDIQNINNSDLNN